MIITKAYDAMSWHFSSTIDCHQQLWDQMTTLKSKKKKCWDKNNTNFKKSSNEENFIANNWVEKVFLDPRLVFGFIISQYDNEHYNDAVSIQKKTTLSLKMRQFK